MQLKLGDSIKELYTEMARKLRSAAIDDSLTFSKKIDLIWSAFEKTNKQARALIDSSLLKSYNEGYSDMENALHKNEHKPKRRNLFSLKKPQTATPELKRYAAEAMAQIREAGYSAINTLTNSIPRKGGPGKEDKIKTSELNDFVILAGRIIRDLEIRIYAAGAEEVPS